VLCDRGSFLVFLFRSIGDLLQWLPQPKPRVERRRSDSAALSSLSIPISVTRSGIMGSAIEEAEDGGVLVDGVDPAQAGRGSRVD
jgi:hypothetical protein